MGGLIYVWQWMNHRNMAKQVEELDRRHSAQLFRMELLELEIDYLTRPERLKSLSTAIIDLSEAEDGEQLFSFSSITESNP